MPSFPKPGFPSLLCWKDLLTCLSGFPYFANIGLKNVFVSSSVNSTILHFQKLNSWKWLLIDVTLPCFPALLQVFFCSFDIEISSKTLEYEGKGMNMIGLIIIFYNYVVWNSMILSMKMYDMYDYVWGIW